jgi:4-hydroxy-4-methyl-2-oxoglutarate aldolase
MLDRNLALEELRRISIHGISDALDLLGINGGCEGINSLVAGSHVVGPAFTVQFEPLPEGQLAPAAEFIDEVEPGSIIVISNDGRASCTVWGDLLSLAAQHYGILGTVIDGCARDLAAIRELRYPVFARGAYMKSGKNRVRLQAHSVPVVIGRTLVSPGDVVCADDSGSVIVPARRLAEVREFVRRIEETELRIAAAIRAGVPLREARRRCRYNEISLVRAQ